MNFFSHCKILPLICRSTEHIRQKTICFSRNISCTNWKTKYQGKEATSFSLDQVLFFTYTYDSNYVFSSNFQGNTLIINNRSSMIRLIILLLESMPFYPLTAQKSLSLKEVLKAWESIVMGPWCCYVCQVIIKIHNIHLHLYAVLM